MDPLSCLHSGCCIFDLFVNWRVYVMLILAALTGFGGWWAGDVLDSLFGVDFLDYVLCVVGALGGLILSYLWLRPLDD